MSDNSKIIIELVGSWLVSMDKIKTNYNKAENNN
jgi:hypothetical protein